MKSVFTYIDQYKPLKLPLHGVRLPTFDIESKYKKAIGVAEDIDNFNFLRALCLEGFKKLKVPKDSPDYNRYIERAKYELEILKELGFVDYILLVWDVINFCKVNEIPIGLGRGSAAGSLVLYLVGVTRIDPIKYDLFFERFISKFRAKKSVVDGITYLDGSLMCDIDIDVCYYNRQKVLEYLEQKFKGRTAKILTLNTLSGKLLIKECGKIVGGKPEQEMTEVTDLIPKLFGNVRDIEETYGGKKDDNGKWKTEPVEAFKKWCDENKEVYEIALKLRGLIKNKGVHASGVLLSHEPIEESCPTELSSDKHEVSAYDMNFVSIVNVKLDILGLRSASVVYDVCKNVGINIEDIDLNDPFIYQQLQDLKSPHGLFQIEADTNCRVCQKVRPKNLEELSGVLALARPGALQFVDQYAAFTNHGTYDPIHPFFDQILQNSGGVAMYQEQLMKMAHKIGFTLDEAEILRRIVGKKKVKEMAEWEEKVKAKIKENNLDPEIAPILWKIMDASKDYSFNKSHSISYAALAATTIYLKFKYPQQFYLSLLRMSRHEPDPISEIAKIQKELQYFGMQLLPPHILKSQMDFSTEGKDIRFGLLSIKGISDKSIEKINGFRSEYSSKFEIFQGAEEAGLPIGVLSALIQAGALEGFKQSRSKVVLEAQIWNILTEKEKKYALLLGKDNDYDLIRVIKKLTTTLDEKGKPVMKAPEGVWSVPNTVTLSEEELNGKRSKFRFVTFYKKYKPYREIYDLNSRSQEFANWWYEKQLLGYTYDKTLRHIFRDKNPDLEDIKTINELQEGERALFIGSVVEAYQGVSKKANARTGEKSKYLRLNVTDESASITVLMFNDSLERCKAVNDGAPKEDNIVIVSGKKMKDCIFADVIGVQDQKVYTKLSQLKSKKEDVEPEKELTKT